MTTESDFWIVVFAINGFIFGGFSGWLASQKGRGSFNWFVLGFLFSFIALIAIAASPTTPSKPSHKNEETRGPISMQESGDIGPLRSKVDSFIVRLSRFLLNLPK